MPRASTIAVRIAALAPDDLEQVLGNLAGNRSRRDQIENGAKLRGRHRRSENVLAFLVETAGEFVDHPVGSGLGVAALGDLLEEGGDLPFGDQHVGVIGGKADSRA